MNLIEIKNLSLGYSNNKVIDNLSINIEEGMFLCVVGHNGSGKSTFIKGLLGLIKPMNGSINYTNLTQNFIGYLPQETKIDKNFPASCKEIVLSGFLNRTNFYSIEQKKQASEIFKTLGIEELENKSFSELSGGQRQKVLLARSLIATSKLLILDEPSNNLDSESKKELYSILTKLNKQGLTIIMITHDLDHNNLIGNYILSLNEREVFFGKTEDFVKKVHEC